MEPTSDPTARPGRGFLLPRDADPRIAGWTGPHYHSAPRAELRQDRLVLILPGTLAQPRDYRLLADQASDLGSHALVLRYPNDRAINEMAGQDPSIHRPLRMDFWDGGDRTSMVSLGPADSILGRLRSALAHLERVSAMDGWGRFLSDGEPAWERIAVFGHSLGGGYAALAARLHAVERAVAFGWADWCRPTGKIADWVLEKDWHPRSNRFAFLHERDEMVPLSVGMEVAEAFCGDGSAQRVESGDPPWGRSRILSTDLDPSSERDVPVPCHSCLALDANTPRWPDGQAVFADAWTWFLVGMP
ncbi:MAG: hypothetical protein IPK50_23930 [Fibrobacterota bacterium]|nr:hypothetical protein [Fibrobacterota bacterium]QQS05284.1 MAG: hypothetical protein IPK50_23930 [Fibrobacterota bacterium]